MSFDRMPNQDSENRSVLNSAVHAAVGSIWTDESSQTRNDVERYATEFVKAVPLFIGAKWAAPVAAVAFGLDEVKTGDSLGMQAAELVAGSAKGYLTKRSFDFLGAKQWGFAQKGIAMGGAARLIDSGLTPQNYFADPANGGGVDLQHGMRNALMNAGDAKALGIDLLTFGAAHYVPGFMSGSKMARSAMLTSSLTGATFGFTSGTLGELQREMHNGEQINVGSLLRAGGLEAGLMGAAAATGHALTPRAVAARDNGMITVDAKPEDRVSTILRTSEQPASAAGGGKEPAGYVGYFLTPESVTAAREGLVIGGESVPVRWTPPERMHVTEQFGIKQGEGETWASQAAQSAPRIRVIGLATDATGVEALHVSVDGKTERADGKPYHVTRSLAEGRKASESMTVVQKALAPANAEESQRYSYRELAPNEQFDLTYQPQFRASDTTAPKAKEVKPPKPEVPFDEMQPRQQVIAALKETPPDYLARTIATRTPEQRAGSYFDLQPDRLRQELYKAQWEPYNPLDADGSPIIGGGARGYRATIPGGRLGMTSVDAIPETAKLFLIDPKGTGNWSVSTLGAAEPVTDHVTMIVGDGDNGKPIVWTFHPGEPVRPSALDTARMREVLSQADIDTNNLPENGPGRRIQITRAQLDAINAALPEQSRMTMAKIETAANLPRFQEKLAAAEKNPEEVSRATQIRGIEFEMSRYTRALEQGLETVADQWPQTEPVEYLGYSRRASDFSAPPHEAKKSAVTSDVPIVREDGRPYIYDVNASPRRLYGTEAQQRNQILKYQAAIDQGTINGATVEINGRVSPEFVQWLTGKVVGDPVAAPDVEVLYTIDLPSGADYTFILKRAANNNGLRFTNADRSYTTEDRRIISGIYKAIQDRSIGTLISGTNIESPPAELAPYVQDPVQLTDLRLFKQYDRLRMESTWAKLREKAESDRVNEANPRNATTEYNTRQYIDEATRWYQDHLKQNPQTAKAKQSYVIKSEEAIQSVVDRAYERAQKIKEFEMTRATSPEESAARAQRSELGYAGLPEGYALDMEHIIMDATQEQNKGGNRRGRTYDQPERFIGVEQVLEYLNREGGQDRRSVDTLTYDPLSGKADVSSNVTDQHVEKTRSTLELENLSRARERIEANERRYEELRANQNRTDAENDELRALIPRHAGYSVQRSAIARVERQIADLTQQRKASSEAIGKNLKSLAAEDRQAVIDEMKRKAAEFDERIATARRELQRRYTEILGGESEWNKLAKRLSIQEQNIIKFMYVVKADGSIPLTEEIIRGEAAGRAAHSELAEGRNVYGAGELVFQKDSATGKWVLTEINNASGHYRPPGADTLVYVRNLVQRSGVDTSRAILNDALQRGTPLVDAHLLDAPAATP